MRDGDKLINNCLDYEQVKVLFRVLGHFMQGAQCDVCHLQTHKSNALSGDWLMNVDNNKLPFSAGTRVLVASHYAVIFLSQKELVGY